ncbi:hypothetical protein V6N12_010007 [Hibiscus sabdariffa]|uniref:RNase H type-1 domain-containing protein n=1 Tax=Hibiscus sabdariffa TaxID=183260 RepID=A0ABR2ECD3_9ROSI
MANMAKRDGDWIYHEALDELPSHIQFRLATTMNSSLAGVKDTLGCSMNVDKTFTVCSASKDMCAQANSGLHNSSRDQGRWYDPPFDHCDGNWLVDSSKDIRVCLVLEAELWRIYEGLHLARKHVGQQIVVEVDNAEASNLIRDSHRNTPRFIILHHIFSLLNHD